MAGMIEMETAEHQGSPGHWRLVFVLMAIYAYAFVDRVILSLLVDPIKADLGASDVQMSLMLGMAFAALFGLSSIPAGHYIDTINRKKLIAYASVAWATMTIICGTSTTLTQLFIGRMGVGITEAVITPAAFSLIRDAVPSRSRGLAFSIFAMSPMLGGATSLIGGSALLSAATAGAFQGVPFLGDLAPWQATLVLVGLCGLPFSLGLLLIKEPARGATSQTAPQGSMFANLAEASRYMIANARLYAPLLFFAAIAATIPFCNGAWLPAAFSRQWQMLPQEMGPMLGLLTLTCGVAGLFIGGIVMNGIIKRGGDIRRYGALAALFSAVGIAGAMLAPSAAIGFGFVGFGMFFLGNSYAVGATTLADITPIAMMGRVSAIYLLIQNLVGQALGPLAVAVVADRFFEGPFALPHGLVLSVAMFAVATMISALVLGRAVMKDKAVSSE